MSHAPRGRPVPEPGRPRSFLLALLTLALTACTGAGALVDSGRPSMVVTTSVLGDVAAQAVGEHVDVTVLMPPGADPHSFELSAAEMSGLLDADLIVANGLGLEEGLADPLAAARDAGVRVVEVGPELDPIAYGVEAGDSAGQPDPHVWTDPNRMAEAAELLGAWVAALHGADPDADASAGAYAAHVRAAADEMAADLASIPDPRRRLVTNHHVFGYFAQAFDFEVIGAVVPSGATLASPSAADLAELSAAIRHADVPAIFADSSQPTRLADALAAEAGLDVEVVPLHTESLGPPGSGADTYLGMLRTNTALIRDALT